MRLLCATLLLMAFCAPLLAETKTVRISVPIPGLTKDVKGMPSSGLSDLNGNVAVRWIDGNESILPLQGEFWLNSENGLVQRVEVGLLRPKTLKQSLDALNKAVALVPCIAADTKVLSEMRSWSNLTEADLRSRGSLTASGNNDDYNYLVEVIAQLSYAPRITVSAKPQTLTRYAESVCKPIDAFPHLAPSKNRDYTLCRFSPDGTRIIYSSLSQVIIADPRTCKPLSTFDCGETVGDCMFGSDGKSIAITTLRETAEIWDVVKK